MSEIKVTHYVQDHPLCRMAIEHLLVYDDWVEPKVLRDRYGLKVHELSTLNTLLSESKGCGAIERWHLSGKRSLIRCKNRDILIKVLEKSYES